MSGLEARRVGDEDGRDFHDEGTSVLTGMLLVVVMVMGVVMVMVMVGQ